MTYNVLLYSTNELLELLYSNYKLLYSNNELLSYGITLTSYKDGTTSYDTTLTNTMRYYSSEESYIELRYAKDKLPWNYYAPVMSYVKILHAGNQIPWITTFRSRVISSHCRSVTNCNELIQSSHELLHQSNEF